MISLVYLFEVQNDARKIMKIRPYSGVGPFNFDMPKEIVNYLAGEKVDSVQDDRESLAKHNIKSNTITVWYGKHDLSAIFDATTEKLIAIGIHNITNKYKPMFQGISVFDVLAIDFHNHVAKTDKSANKIIENGITSKKYGIGTYAYGLEDPDPKAKIGSITIGSKEFWGNK